MGLYFWQKSLSLVLTAVLVSLVTFIILQVLPGDPALLVLGTEASPQALANLRAELKLDEPAPARYLQWLASFFTGSWGNSLRYSLPVRELLGQAFPLSLALAFLAVAAALAAAIPGGIYISSGANRSLRRFFSLTAQLGMAVPQFWLGVLLIRIFAVRLRILPPGGADGWLSLVLPVLTLSLPRAAVLTRQVQIGVREALKSDYIRTARAKGLPESVVFYKHALVNGAISVFTIAGVQLAQLLAGTVVVEQVFGLPGVGQLLLTGVMQRDLPLVQALVMIIAILIILLNFIADLLLGFLDPRIRYE